MKTLLIVPLVLALLGTTACKKKADSNASKLVDRATGRDEEELYEDFKEIDPPPAAELIETRLPREPAGALEKAAASSSIPWQPLSPATLAEAADKGMPVFLVCCGPHLNSPDLFEVLDRNTEFKARLKAGIIPAVVDILNQNAYAVEADMSALHSGEQTANFPMFFVLSPEGIPLLAQGIPQSRLESNAKSLTNLVDSLMSDWKQKLNFYSNDGLKMLQKRRQRNVKFLFEEVAGDRGPDPDGSNDYQLVIKLENSSFNAATVNSSNPVMLLNSLFAIANDPAASKDLRRRSAELASRAGRRCAHGGLHLSFVGAYGDRALYNSFALPRGACSLPIQAACVDMLAQLYWSTGLQHFKRQAIELAAWVDRELALDTGFYAYTYYLTAKPKDRSISLLFDHERLHEALSEPSMELLETTLKVAPSGNLSYGEQPDEGFSSLNRVTPEKSAAEHASDAGLPLEEYLERRAQLDRELASLFQPDKKFTSSGVPSIGATLDRVDMDLTLLALTGETSRLEQARERLELCIAETEKRMRRNAGDSNQSYSPHPSTRTILHLANSSLSLYELTKQARYLDLATEMERFVADELEDGLILAELPPSEQLMQFSAISVFSMLEPDSVSQLARLRKRLGLISGRDKLVNQADALLKRLSLRIVRDPQFGATSRTVRHQHNYLISLPNPPEASELQKLARLQRSGFTIKYADQAGQNAGKMFLRRPASDEFEEKSFAELLNLLALD